MQACSKSSGGIRKDERRSEPVDEDDSWVRTLRERIALDKPLVFTAGDASVMKHNQLVGAPYPSRLIFSLSASPTLAESVWRIALCGRDQIMRKGIHRAIFTCEEDNAYFRLGVLGTKPLKGKFIRSHTSRSDEGIAYDIFKRTEETESGLECDLAASHVSLKLYAKVTRCRLGSK